MVYNLKKLSATYVKGFKKYASERGIDKWSQEDLYNLFAYSLNRLYGLEASSYGKGISRYGKSCTKYLGEMKCTPNHPDKVSFSDKVSLISMAQSYYAANLLLKGKVEVEDDQESL